MQIYKFYYYFKLKMLCVVQQPSLDIQAYIPATALCARLQGPTMHTFLRNDLVIPHLLQLLYHALAAAHHHPLKSRPPQLHCVAEPTPFGHSTHKIQKLPCSQLIVGDILGKKQERKKIKPRINTLPTK